MRLAFLAASIKKAQADKKRRITQGTTELDELSGDMQTVYNHFLPSQQTIATENPTTSGTSPVGEVIYEFIAEDRVDRGMESQGNDVSVSVTSPVSATKFVTSPASLGESITSPASAGGFVTSPASLGESITSPASAGGFVTSPASLGESITSPATVGESVTSPESLGESVTSPTSDGKGQPPYEINGYISLDTTVPTENAAEATYEEDNLEQSDTPVLLEAACNIGNRPRIATPPKVLPSEQQKAAVKKEEDEYEEIQTRGPHKMLLSARRDDGISSQESRIMLQPVTESCETETGQGVFVTVDESIIRNGYISYTDAVASAANGRYPRVLPPRDVPRAMNEQCKPLEDEYEVMVQAQSAPLGPRRRELGITSKTPRFARESSAKETIGAHSAEEVRIIGGIKVVNGYVSESQFLQATPSAGKAHPVVSSSLAVPAKNMLFQENGHNVIEMTSLKPATAATATPAVTTDNGKTITVENVLYGSITVENELYGSITKS